MTPLQLKDLREGAEVGALLSPDNTLTLLNDLEGLQVACSSFVGAFDKLMRSKPSFDRGVEMGKLINSLLDALENSQK